MPSQRAVKHARGAHQRINISVQSHPAFLTMTPTAQLVLIDLYAANARWTRYYTVDLPEPGFPYSFAHCSYLIHRNTFYAAMQQILERGFIIETDRDSRRSEIRYYKPHNAWKKYTPTRLERVAMHELRRKMQRADDRDERRFSRSRQSKLAQFLCAPQHIFWAVSKAHKHIFSATSQPSSTENDEPLHIGEGRRSRSHAYALPNGEKDRNGQDDPQPIADLIQDASDAITSQDLEDD